MIRILSRLSAKSLVGALLISAASTVSAHAFDQSDLDKALAGNQCPRCDLSGADLRNVNWKGGGNFDEADFSGANLSGVSMRNVSMTRANLSNADLTNITGYNWQLYEANLTGAQLSGTSFRESNLWKATGVDVSGTKICDSDLPNGDRAGAC